MTSVSIVITCYNLGAYLDEAIQSALDQTYPDVEVLVVDDGSTDQRTIEVLDRLQSHPRLRILRTPNQGVARARNLGFSEARGEYILPLDADDRIKPEYVARAAEVLDHQPFVGFVGCHYQIFGEREGMCTPEAYVLPDLLVENVVPIASLIRRSCWEEVGGYCPELNSIEDWDLWIGILGRDHAGFVLPEILFEYRVRPHSNLSLARDPEIYQQRMSLLYTRHWTVFDRYKREVLLGKDRQFAILHSHTQWLHQQARNWERVAQERQQAVDSLVRNGGRVAVVVHWYERQQMRWRRLSHSNLSFSSRMQIVAGFLVRNIKTRFGTLIRRLTRHL
jgi:glycosyltransferase involved in cell wall biosynthesis